MDKMKQSDFQILTHVTFNYGAIGLNYNYILSEVDMQEGEVMLISPIRQYIIDLDKTDFIDYLESNDHLETDVVRNNDLAQEKIEYDEFIEIVTENDFALIVANYFMGIEHHRFEQVLKDAKETELLENL